MLSVFPKVSIVIPVFNGSNYLKQAIDSALAQTYPNIEVIVVNDGSTDNGATERIALSYGEKIQYLKRENGGVGAALNLAIKEMSGEYFSWLSHDDMYTPEKVQCQMEALAITADKTMIVACGFLAIDAEGNPLFEVNPIQSGPGQEILQKPLYALLHGHIHGCSLLIHKNHFERVGLFREELKSTQDYDLWFRMMRKQKIIFIDGLHVISRRHDEQSSKKQFGTHISECNVLWRNIIDSMDTRDMVILSGSPRQFYKEIWTSLKQTTPYGEAEAYAKELYDKEVQGTSVKAYKEDNAYLKRALNNNEAFVTLLQTQAKELRAELEASNWRNSLLQEKLDETQLQCESLQNKLETSNWRNSLLQEKLDETQLQCESLQNKLETSNWRNGLLQEKLDETQLQCESLQNKLETSNRRSGLIQEKLDDTEQRCAMLEAQIEQLCEEKSLCQSEIANLQAENKKVQAQYKVVEGSLSWRMTKPLRFGKRIFTSFVKKILQKIKDKSDR